MEPSKTKVLVVDDFELIRRVVKDALVELEFSDFVEASNGQEAIDALVESVENQTPIQMVFLDWNMPVKNGIDVLKFCRAHKDLKDIPVIMITAEGEKKQVLTALASGASDYVVKPCSPKIIKQKVLNVFAKQKKAS